MKKTITLFLIAAMLTSLCACGQSETQENDTASSSDTALSETESAAIPEETMKDYLAELPEASYDGFTYRILAVPEENCPGIQSFWAEEATGEIINDVVFARNSYVQERYNIVMAYEAATGVITTAANLAKAGDDTYAVVSDEAKLHMASATQGIFYDLHKIESIDLASPWWYQDAVDALTIAGKLYAGYSDINTQIKERVACMFINLDIVENNSLDDPYQMVLNGTWTLDAATGMAATAVRDLDGDGKLGENDIAGTIVGIGSYNVMINGCDQPLASKDEDGNVTLRYGSEGFINAAEKVAAHINDRSIGVYLNTDPWGEQLFYEGNALLYSANLFAYNKMRDFESHFGIVPIPKYNEAQERYRSMMNNSSMGISIPISVRDAECVGAITEALNAFSYMHLKDAYYETLLKGKLARDETSLTMLDIITTSFIVDYGVMNENTWGTVISSWMDTMTSTGPSGLAALHASNLKMFDKIYGKILSSYEQNP